MRGGQHRYKYITILDNVICKCPSCSSYLTTIFSHRLSTNGKNYRVLQCITCGYKFSENVMQAKAIGHLAKLRKRLIIANAKKRGIDSEINNLTVMLQLAESRPREYKKMVQGGEMITV